MSALIFALYITYSTPCSNVHLPKLYIISAVYLPSVKLSDVYSLCTFKSFHSSFLLFPLTAWGSSKVGYLGGDGDRGKRCELEVKSEGGEPEDVDRSVGGRDIGWDIADESWHVSISSYDPNDSAWIG